MRSRTFALGGIGILAAVVVAALALGGRPGGHRSRVDADGDGKAAGGGVGLDARRVATLAALRDGRLDEAFAWYAGPDRREPGAEELHALGAALLARDRLVLGWTAMEASHRVDRDHEGANGALGALEKKLNLSGGAERAARSEAAEAVEHLRAVRGGPALGLLAMGLARYADRPGQERALLDRLLIRDRPELQAVDGPAGAIKLVSRLLMETGRAAEARDLLGLLTGTNEADGEVAWLLSRAALQLGQPEEADALLERAGGFGRDGSSSEPSPYVGSRRCGECHRSAYRAAQQASPHARTISLGPGLRDAVLPGGPVPDSVDPRIAYRFARESPDRIRLEARDERGRVARAIVAYALGSGEHGMTMVARDEATGTPRELRVSYYAADHSWRGTKGVKGTPHTTEELIGLELTEKALRECLHCHTTWFRAALPDPSMPEGPEVHDRGIGCERCHGPGLNHVRAVESGFAEPAIAVTAASPPRQLMKSCEECHASKGTVEPSDPEFTRLQGTTLRFSRCFTASGGAIHCATCHDPHRGLETRAPRYEEKCLGCHVPPARRSPGTTGAKDCPVNPSSGCVACHMPKVRDPSLETRFTDHHIRVHREDLRDGRGPADDRKR